jgi:TP901 family phage tail tape measure protein
MADNVEVKVSADDSDVGRGLSNASNKVSNFANKAEQEAKKTEKAWEQSSKKVGKYMLAMSAAITAGFAASTKVSATYDQNLRNVNTIAGLTEKGLKGLSGEILKLSQSDKITKGPRELSNALFEIYGAGLKGEKAMATLAVAAKAADTGLTDVKTAASPLVQTMIAFGASADKAAQIGDVLAKTVEIGKIEFTDLAQSIGPVMSRAAAFGVTVEEVGAAMAVLSQTMPAAEAATSLERLITSMAAPTPEAAKEMDRLGVAYGRTQLQAKGLIGVLEEIRTKTQGSDLDFRKLLHSSEALQAGLALTASKGKLYKDSLGEMGEAHGTLDHQLTEQLKGAEKKWALFLKQAEIAAVQAGDVILPIATDALEKATGIIKAFSALDPEQKKFVIGATGVAGGLTAIVGGLAVSVPALRNARIAISAVAVAMRGLANPISATVLLMAGLYEAFEHNWFGMRDIARESARDIRESMELLRLPGFDPQGKGFNAAALPGMVSSAPYGTKPGGLVQPSTLGVNLRNQSGLKVNMPNGAPVADEAGNLNASALPKSPIKVEIVGQAGVNLANLKGGVDHAPKVVMDAIALSSQALEATKGLGKAIPEKTHNSSPGPIRVHQEGGGGSEIERLKQEEKARKEAERASKKRQSAQDQEVKLRLKYLESMRSLVGKSTEEIRLASGGVGDSFNQCANTVRLGAKNMGEAFPVAKNPYDKGKLRPGEGIGAAHADSLFSAEIGKYFTDRSKAKIGDLAFFDSPERPGVVQHVGTVSGPGRMIDASSGRGQVVERGLDSLGSSRRLMGFISPSMFDKSKGSKISGADYAEEWRQRQAQLDEKWRSVQDEYLNEFEREIAELDQADKNALESAPNKEAYDRVHSAISAKRMRAQANLHMTEMGPDGQLQPITADLEREQEKQEQIISLSKQRWDLEFEMSQRVGATEAEQRTANIALYQERLQQIQGLSQLQMAGEQTQTELLLEKHALEQQIWAEKTAEADLQLQRKLEEWELDGQLGEQDTARKLEWINRELVAFQGSEQMRQNLMQQRRALEVQMQLEQWQMADAVYSSIEQSFSNMLVNAIGQQTNFNQIFQTLWKQIAQSILSELAKMIVKALALQAIFRSISGFFGGIFGIGGEVASTASSAASFVGPTLPAAMGFIGPTFHDGGMVGRGPAIPNFRPDEVIAKLQTGEMVLNRMQVGALSDLDIQGGGVAPSISISMGDVHLASDMDARKFSRDLGLEVSRRLQGKV